MDDVAPAARYTGRRRSRDRRSGNGTSTVGGAWAVPDPSGRIRASGGAPARHAAGFDRGTHRWTCAAEPRQYEQSPIDALTRPAYLAWHGDWRGGNRSSAY